MNIAVIGTNFVSDSFMTGASLVNDCHVVAVCATSMEKASQFAKRYNIPECFANYQDLLNIEALDAVYLGVPNSKHFELAAFFLSHKIAVFCEKPLTANFTEAVALTALAKTNNTYLQEGIMPLYHPNFQILKSALQLIGPIRQVHLNFSKYSSRYDAYLAGDNPTTFRRELANGAIMDLGVYPISVAVGLWGKPIKVHSVASLLDTKVDVAGHCWLQYPQFNVSISYSKASDTYQQSEICGELGTLTIDGMSLLNTITYYPRATQIPHVLCQPGINHFACEIQTMIDALALGQVENLVCDFATSLAIQETITQARHQAGIYFPQDQK